MKPFVLALTFVAALLAGCSADITGPGEEDRALEPAKGCSINVRLC